jgi:hypothetical protein
LAPTACQLGNHKIKSIINLTKTVMMLLDELLLTEEKQMLENPRKQR